MLVLTDHMMFSESNPRAELHRTYAFLHNQRFMQTRPHVASVCRGRLGRHWRGGKVFSPPLLLPLRPSQRPAQRQPSPRKGWGCRSIRRRPGALCLELGIGSSAPARAVCTPNSSAATRFTQISPFKLKTQLTSPESLKNKITTSALCLLEKNPPFRPDWTKQSPVRNLDPRHTPGAGTSPLLWPGAAQPASQPRASGAADVQFSHPNGCSPIPPALPVPGRTPGRLSGAAHLGGAELLSRWPQGPANAGCVSVPSINNRLFLYSINRLFFQF